MKKRSLLGIALLAALALIVSVIGTVIAAPGRMDGLAAFAAAGEGRTWAAFYEADKIAFYLIGKNGVRQSAFSVPRRAGDQVAQIADMTVDAEGNVYFLRQYTGATDGEWGERQELSVYVDGILPFGRLKTVRLSGADDERVRYQGIHVSTSVVITGQTVDGTALVRKAFDLETLTGSGGATIKNLRVYPAEPGEGVYRIATVGTGVVYLSKSGMVWSTVEDAEHPERLYPDEAAERSTYAAFLNEADPGQVIVGEQKSGSVFRLFTADGSIEYILEGARALGNLNYTGRDILAMSFPPDERDAWVAAVQNGATGEGGLVVNDHGDVTLIARVENGLFGVIVGCLWGAVLYLTFFAAVIGAGVSLYRLILKSRMLLVKLIAVSVPLLVVALMLFGVYSYLSYRTSLLGTYETQVADQGNLLRALFSASSFDTITAPGLYSSVEYGYLRAQMATRDVYTSSGYYVDGRLYTGVDADLPCLFPFGIRHSADAERLYRAAAQTGKQQSGVVRDRLGDRMITVTPVGSSSGNTVFLLETGVFQAEIDRALGGFLQSYLLIAGTCLILTCALLMIAFMRILRPLSGIVEGLDAFSKGNRLVRLESAHNDELADITRVFNKMAKDIDVQIYNLRTMGETYYRFVPQQIFRLLGKENLADVTLGSAVEGDYHVLAANLYPRQERQGFSGTQELINRFFGIVHKVAGENGATLLSDSTGLRDLRLILEDGNAAIEAAMAAIARVDEYNAKNPIGEQLSVSFFLHRTRIGFGICGDGERYVPTMISDSIDQTLAGCAEFRRFASRLLVTKAAYDTLDAERCLHRFIGYAPGLEREGDGLFDFYESSSPRAIRAMHETLAAFDKAMALYLQKRYYDAKNIFAMVLRENQYDNVARHYIFQCEKQLQV